MKLLRAVLLSLAVFAGVPAMAEVVFTFPMSRLVVGPGMFNLPRSLTAAEEQVSVTIQQGAWPLTGGRAVIFQIEYSLDGGTTWQAACAADADDVQQGGQTLPDGRVVPLGEFTIGCTVPGVGQARPVRITSLVSKENTSSGSVDAR